MSIVMRAVIDGVGANYLSGWVASSGHSVCVQCNFSHHCETSWVICLGDPRKDISSDNRGFRIEKLGLEFILKICRGHVEVTFLVDGKEIKCEIWQPVKAASYLHGFSSKELDRAVLFAQRLGSTFEVLDGVGVKSPDKDVPFVISVDQSAVIGLQRQLFLYKGSNNVVSLYNLNAVSGDLVDRWVELIRSRERKCSSLGSKFIQVFIPEKSTVLRGIVPYRVDGPNLIWRQITCLASDLSLFDAGKVADFDPCSSVWYRKLDTHFSSYGCKAFSQALCKTLGLTASTSINGVEPFFHKLSGDLGRRFVELAEFEEEDLVLYKSVSSDLVSSGAPELIAKIDPPEGHLGILRVFKNPSPIYDHVVVCFGNSFFERGTFSTSLTWWFSRLFREFHFIWSPDFDHDYVERVRPDFVICQTVERFLGRCPEV